MARLLLLPHSPTCGRRLPGQSQNTVSIGRVGFFFLIFLIFELFPGSYAYFESAFFEDWTFISSFAIKSGKD